MLCPHLLKPTQILNRWCSKRPRENYESSKKESAAPRKKMLLRNFPKSLHLKKKHPENYDIKASVKESDIPRKKGFFRRFANSLQLKKRQHENYKNSEKIRMPRKKGLLRNFPEPLHFKKAKKEPRGAGHGISISTGGFWKQIHMFSHP